MMGYSREELVQINNNKGIYTMPSDVKCKIKEMGIERRKRGRKGGRRRQKDGSAPSLIEEATENLKN